MAIYLLRHCDYDNPRNILPGRLPVALSASGTRQAQTLQAHFADKQITKIYSSAVLRCKQTAEIVSGGTIPIVYDPRLLEIFSAYQGYWGQNWDGTGFHFLSHRNELGGENFADVKARMADFWDELRQKEDGNIIICSHGDPLQILYCYIHNLPLADEAAQEADLPGWLDKGEFLEITL
jgi:broad specificity phosphatase PhoE